MSDEVEVSVPVTEEVVEQFHGRTRKKVSSPDSTTPKRAVRRRRPKSKKSEATPARHRASLTHGRLKAANSRRTANDTAPVYTQVQPDDADPRPIAGRHSQWRAALQATAAAGRFDENPDLLARLRAYDPLIELALQASDEAAAPALRARCHHEVARFIYGDGHHENGEGEGSGIVVSVPRWASALLDPAAQTPPDGPASDRPASSDGTPDPDHPEQSPALPAQIFTMPTLSNDTAPAEPHQADCSDSAGGLSGVVR